MKIKLFILTGCLLFQCVHAQIKMPGIFGDHMVMQRNQGVPVWGWSSPGEKVVVQFNNEIKETHANRQGKWRINLDSQAAGGPYTLRITGKTSLVFQDVMVGEVWICSGQSNMEFELRTASHGLAEIRQANNPEIRQIKIPLRVGNTPKEDIASAKWDVCSSATAGNFTAVGYFFAKELSKRLRLTVGLINSSWGGTNVETWTSRGAFENSPEFKSMIAAKPVRDLDLIARQKQVDLERQIKLLQKNITDSLPENEWKNPAYNGIAWPKISVSETWESQSLGLDELDGIVWYRKEITLDANTVSQPLVLSLGKIDDNDTTYVNGVLVGATNSYNTDRIYNVPAGVFKEGRNLIAVRVEDNNGGGGFYGDSTSIQLKTASAGIPLGDNWHFRIAQSSGNSQGTGPNDYPCLLYNAMIHPLIPYAIRGVLWYQGESNAGRAHQYRIAFPLMINDWRQHWGQGNFPFYFVQLASFNADNGNSERGSSWAELREAQTRSLQQPNTGMAVTTDIGESLDIHPKNKQDVGWRLAAIALNNIYAIPMVFSGPRYDSFSVDGSKIILHFTQTGSGLMAQDKYGYVRGFEIAGPDKHFHFAKAFIRDQNVIVSADEVSYPKAVRYAWADDAGEANLFNKEGFPAVSFRTDQWKGITEDKKYVVQ